MNKIYVFAHIPKAAGSSLRYVFKKNFRNVYELKGYKNKKELARLQKKPDRIKESALLIGHIPHGIHNYLKTEVQYITMLRNPIHRVVSNYNYILNSPHHYLYERIHYEKSRIMSIKEFVSHENIVEGRDFQTRMLSADKMRIKKEIFSEDLDRAKQNLARYVYGFTENYDKFLDKLYVYGIITNGYSPKINETVYRHYKYHPSEDDLDVISDYNKYDIDLYKWAINQKENVGGEQHCLSINNYSWKDDLYYAGKLMLRDLYISLRLLLLQRKY